MSEQLPRLLIASEVAEILRVKEDTLYSWRLRGVGPPAIKLDSGAVRYPADQLQEWFAEQQRANAV